MKIIDLLNKIAKGEEVPKKIKYNGVEYSFNISRNTYIDEYDNGFGYSWTIDIILNNVVEILEEVEDKEYEDIE